MSANSPKSGKSERVAKSATSAGMAPVAPRSRFYSRVGKVALISASLVLGTLVIGGLGYRFIAGLSWVIAFHQAALLLSGMGPVETSLGTGGRIFESVYALFCGVILLGATGLLFAPFIHRMLHKFHVEDSGE